MDRSALFRLQSSPQEDRLLLFPPADSRARRLRDILALMKSVYYQHPSVKLQIIYDLHHEDFLNLEALTKGLSSKATALSLFRYEAISMTETKLLNGNLGKNLILGLCSPSNIIDIFSKIRHHRLKSHAAKWLFLLTDVSLQEDFLRSLEDLIFEGTYITILIRDSPGIYTALSSGVNEVGKIRFLFKGKWTSKSTEKMNKPLSYIMAPEDGNLYKDMRGRKMTITTIKCWPFFGLADMEDGGVQPTYGIDVMILEALASTLNFTFHIVTPEDGSWGLPQADGSVTGMIGMVARREADVALSVIGVNELRARVIDYTDYYYQGTLGIFSRAPKEKNRALAVLAPFTLEVWMYIITSILLVGPLLRLLSETSYRLLQTVPSASLQGFSFNLFRNFVVQGNQIASAHWPERLIFYFWYLFCLILSALYSGMLIAVLAIPAFETPINALEELPKAVQNGFTLGVMKDSTNEMIFKEAKEGIYKEVWSLFNHEDRPQSFVDGIATGVSRIYGSIL
ncbi:glutamate receptor ionotropic, delta-2-like [Palaemon carinicauda]|uniref:glutamate receptor ionotropic, delta-2-like n=1 Tax=Palaemon carinicauda TaxID=392227 RepID=UPI0035B61B4F